MSDKFNEFSSDDQYRAEKIEAIRRSIHGESETAPADLDNINESAETEDISERIQRAKEKKQDAVRDILDELDAAIAREKEIAAKLAEEAAAAAADTEPVEIAPEPSVQEEPSKTDEPTVEDFTEVEDTDTADTIDLTEENIPSAEEESLEEIFSVREDEKTEIFEVTEKAAAVTPAVTNAVSAEKTAAEVKTAVTPADKPIPEAVKSPEVKAVADTVQAAAGTAADTGKKKKHKKKKRSLKQRFIDLVPHKGDGVGECIRKIVFLCSIIAIVVCGYFVADYYYDLWSSKRKTKELMEIYDIYEDTKPHVEENTPEDDGRKRYLGMLDGARKLYDLNHDIVGVISIPDTPLNNPVLQADDNNKYLDKKYDLSDNVAGEIFLDYRNHFDDVGEDGYLKYPNSDNLVLYGHDMYDDQMFGFLKYYVRNEAYYGLHPVIDLSSNYERYKYKIFSFFILDSADDTDTKFDCWNNLDFSDEEDFYRFVNEAKRRTIRTNDVDVEYGDSLLTLSTCSTYLADDDRGRLIILARRVRDGEDPMKGTQDSKPNPNIKWPTLYYADHPNEHYNPDAEFVPYGPKGGK